MMTMTDCVTMKLAPLSSSPTAIPYLCPSVFLETELICQWVATAFKGKEARTVGTDDRELGLG